MIVLNYLIASIKKWKSNQTLIRKYFHHSLMCMDSITKEKMIMKIIIKVVYNILPIHHLMSWLKKRRKSFRLKWACQFYLAKKFLIYLNYSIKKSLTPWKAQNLNGFSIYCKRWARVRFKNLTMLLYKMEILSANSQISWKSRHSLNRKWESLHS